MSDISSTTSPGRGASILLVEDDPIALQAFAEVLTAEGYTVRTAPDAPSAFAELERAAPEAVLLDMHLPISSGLDVLRRLRTMPGLADVPVAIVTGNYMLEEEVARELHALGAKLYFKPVWNDDLIQIVGTLLGR